MPAGKRYKEAAGGVSDEYIARERKDAVRDDAGREGRAVAVDRARLGRLVSGD